MARDLILALDQGTTSTRAILFDRAGQALVVPVGGDVRGQRVQAGKHNLLLAA